MQPEAVESPIPPESAASASVRATGRSDSHAVAGLVLGAVRAWLVALAVVFTVTAVGLLALPGAAIGWSGNSFSTSSESELLALTNRARAAAGLRSLRRDSTLASIARSRSRDMIERNYFSHSIPPSGKSVFDVMQDRGYCFSLAGENIGWNTYPDDQATGAIQSMFMNSSGHRSNILGRRWEVVGIGAYKGSDGKKMWTVVFADKCGSVGGGKATPKPAPKATRRPAARPITRTTPRPTQRSTARPRPTGALVPSASPEPAATPDTGGVTERSPSPTSGGEVPLPEPSPSPGPTGPPEAPGPTTAPSVPIAGSLRIGTASPSSGLVESVVGGVFGLLFGGS